MININVIPALPGFNIVHIDDNTAEITVGSPVIAWRIVSRFDDEGSDDDLYSRDDHIEPITSMTSTSLDSNYFGIQNPDGSISSYWGEYHYKNLDEVRELYCKSLMELNEKFNNGTLKKL